MDRDGIRRLLLSAKFREEYTGHFTVAISLSEAATIRRIMHLRSQRPDLVVDGSEDTALALRVLPAGNMLLDTSLQFEKAFVADVARALELPTSRVVIGAVRGGSVIVDFFLLPEARSSVMNRSDVMI